jgi:ADP-ribose pyrophosphatase YjhB (NUDIX family)
MASMSTPFDYDGALVVVETNAGEIVLIHPPGGPLEAPASLPSDPCRPGEPPQEAAVRMVREMTGLDVTIVQEFITFIQEGTPTGTMNAHGYMARVTGGTLRDDGRRSGAGARDRYVPVTVPRADELCEGRLVDCSRAGTDQRALRCDAGE